MDEDRKWAMLRVQLAERLVYLGREWDGVCIHLDQVNEVRDALKKRKTELMAEGNAIAGLVNCGQEMDGEMWSDQARSLLDKLSAEVF